jgi:hypothetical protein
MSQAIEGIRHFRKCLVISGNDSAIAGIPVLPRQLWELQAFLDMLIQLGKFCSFCLFKFSNLKFLETAQHKKYTNLIYFKQS